MDLRMILDAGKRIAPFIFRTPLLYSEKLSNLTGFSIYLKPENLQRTGSFKIRGASNLLASLPLESLLKGVITASSGNHGLGVACAGSSLGCSVEVVVPENASRAKIEGIRRYGASVIPFGQSSNERRHFARSKAEAEGKVFVHSHDDPLVICGQGTIGTEILEDLGDIDAVLVPVGGGGLIAGISIAVKEHNPDISVYGVEPEIGCCMKMSLEKKERVELTETPPTIADGLRGTIPGDLPFHVAQKNVDGMISVKEDTIKEGVRLLAMDDKLVVEPSGAVVAAALLEGTPLKKGRKICIILSGGNMEIEKFAQILSGGKDA